MTWYLAKHRNILTFLPLSLRLHLPDGHFRPKFIAEFTSARQGPYTDPVE